MTKKKKVILGLAVLSAIVGGLGLFAFLGGTAVFGASATIVADIGIAGVGLGAAGLATVTTMGVVGTLQLKNLQRQERKYFLQMDKMQNSKDRLSTKTEKARAKISKKYAKAHLKLAKIARVKKGNANLYTLTGHRQNLRESGAYADVMRNKQEAYRVAQQNALASGRTGKANKYGKKASSIDAKLDKKLHDQMQVDTQFQWVRTVRDPYTGKNLQDRRTEIHCHNESTKKAFMELAKEQEINSKVGFASKIVFPDESKLVSTFVNLNDQKLMEKAELILLREAQELADEYGNTVFPLRVIRVDLETGKSTTQNINDSTDLTREIEVLVESEDKIKKGSFLNRQYKPKKAPKAPVENVEKIEDESITIL